MSSDIAGADTRLAALIADVAAETAAFDDALTTIDDDGFGRSTPAEGWTILDQVAHLAAFDDAAVAALTDPVAFTAGFEADLAAGIDVVERNTELGRAKSADEVRTWWHDARRALIETAATSDPSVRVPWYGPAMGVMSFLTARLMETWAHGVDVRDTVGLAPVDSDRLRHIAHIGVGARAYTYRINRLDGIETPVAVVLSRPDAEPWVWGDLDGPNTVHAPALDFCLAVTQRRHLDDLSIDLVGDEARRWMSVAQAFAGGVGTGRAPLD